MKAYLSNSESKKTVKTHVPNSYISLVHFLLSVARRRNLAGLGLTFLVVPGKTICQILVSEHYSCWV